MTLTGGALDTPRRESVTNVGIVVVTFGSPELLERNLATIDLDLAGAQVVVVDNFHSAAARAAICAVCTERGWKFVPMEGNAGFGVAVNVGATRALELGCDAVLVLNPDARLDSDVVRRLADACAAAPMTMISPKIMRPDGRTWFDGSSLDLRSGITNDPDRGADTCEWLSAACLMVHRQLWDRLGGFDPDFFLYWEDVDLSVRCLDAGGSLEVRQDLQAVHEVGGTQGGVKSAAYYYYNCRNRLLFAAKHLSRRHILLWVARTPVASTRILLRGGGKRKLVHSPGLVWPAVRGSVEGLWAALTALLPRRTPTRGRPRW